MLQSQCASAWPYSNCPIGSAGARGIPPDASSRVDIDRGGPTYTRDTLRELQTLNPDSDLYFITGADALASILSWQDWKEMFALARFVGVSRPGYELDGEHIAAKTLHAVGPLRHAGLAMAAPVEAHKAK